MAQYLVFYFSLWLYFSLLEEGGILGEGVRGLLLFLLGSYGVCSSKMLGCQRVLAGLRGGCKQCGSSRSCNLASGGCTPCWLQLRKSCVWLKPCLETRPIQTGKVPQPERIDTGREVVCCCYRQRRSSRQDLGILNWHNCCLRI